MGNIRIGSSLCDRKCRVSFVRGVVVLLEASLWEDGTSTFQIGGKIRAGRKLLFFSFFQERSSRDFVGLSSSHLQIGCPVREFLIVLCNL